MKTLWNAFSFLAVVHLLAILLFVMWLWSSNRVDADRIQSARELFSPTIEQAELAARQAQREDEAHRRDLKEEAMRLDPPLSSEARMRQISRMVDIEQRAMRRLTDERELLFSQLEEAQNRLSQQQAALDAERRAWQESIEADRERRQSEQFAKAVRQYESVPPRQAKNMLLELIESGGIKRAVEYLDAMNARAASKILTEFRTEAEVQLATELLERLRTLGVNPSLPGATQEPDYATGNIADAR